MKEYGNENEGETVNRALREVADRLSRHRPNSSLGDAKSYDPQTRRGVLQLFLKILRRRKEPMPLRLGAEVSSILSRIVLDRVDALLRAVERLFHYCDEPFLKLLAVLNPV